MSKAGEVEVCAPYLVDVDRDVYGDVDKVPKSQTGDKSVGSVPHTLVLVNNPQQCGIAHHSHHKHDTGDKSVNVLKIELDGGGILAGWGAPESGTVSHQGFSGAGLRGREKIHLRVGFGGSGDLRESVPRPLSAVGLTNSTSSDDGHQQKQT